MEEFNSLEGKVIIEVREGAKRYGDDGIRFICEDGSEYWMGHIQDCCENVYLEDKDADWDILYGTPVTFVAVETEYGNYKDYESYT